MTSQATLQKAFISTSELQSTIQNDTNIVLTHITAITTGLYQAQAVFGTVNLKLQFSWPLDANGTVKLAENLNLTIPDFGLFLNEVQSQVGINCTLPFLSTIGIGNYGLSLSNIELKFEDKILVEVKTEVRIPGWDALDAFKLKILHPKVLLILKLKTFKSLLIKATGSLALGREIPVEKYLPVEFKIPIQRSEPLTFKVLNSSRVIPYDYLNGLLTVSKGLRVPGIASQALQNMHVQKLQLSLSNGLSKISHLELIVVAASPWLIGGEFSLENVRLSVNQTGVSFTVTAKVGNEILTFVVPDISSQSGYTLKLHNKTTLPDMESTIKTLLNKTLAGKAVSLPNFTFAKIIGFGLSGKLKRFEFKFSGQPRNLVDISVAVDIANGWQLFDNIPVVVNVSSISLYLAVNSLNGDPKVTSYITGTIAIGNPELVEFPFHIDIPNSKRALTVKLQSEKLIRVNFENLLKIGGMANLPKLLTNLLDKLTVTVSKLNIVFPSNLTSVPRISAFILHSNVDWNLKLVRVANVSLSYENKKYLLSGQLEFAGLTMIIGFNWPPKQSLPVFFLPREIKMNNLVDFIGKMTQNFMSGKDSKLDLKRAGLGKIAGFKLNKLQVALAEDLRSVVEVNAHVSLPTFSWDLLDDFFAVKNVTIYVHLNVDKSVFVEVAGVIDLAGELRIPIQLQVPTSTAQNLTITMTKSKDVVKAQFEQINGLLQSSVGITFPDILGSFLPEIHLRKLKVEFSKKLTVMKITELQAECPKQWDIGGLGILYAKDLRVNMSNSFFDLSGTIIIGGIIIPVQFTPNDFSMPQFRLPKQISIPDLPAFIKAVFQQIVAHEKEIPDGTLVGLDTAMSFVIQTANVRFSRDLKSLVSLDVQILFPRDWAFLSNVFTMKNPTIEIKITDFTSVQVDYEIYISGTMDFSKGMKIVSFPLKVQIPSGKQLPVNLALTSAVEVQMSDIFVLPLVGKIIPQGLVSPVAGTIGSIRINSLSVDFTPGSPTKIKSLSMSTTATKNWKILGLPLEFGNITFKIWYLPNSFKGLLSGTIAVQNHPIPFEIPFLPAVAARRPSIPSTPIQFNFQGVKGLPEFPTRISLNEISRLFVPGFDLPSLLPDPFGAFGMRFQRFELRLSPPLTSFKLEGFDVTFYLDKPVILVKDWLAIENITTELEAKVGGSLRVTGLISCSVRLGTSNNGFRISASLIIPTPPDKRWILKLSPGSHNSISVSKVVSLLSGGVNVKSFFPSGILSKVTTFTLDNLQVDFTTEPQARVNRIICLLQTNLSDVKLPLKMTVDKIQLYMDVQNPFKAAARKVDARLKVWIKIGKALIQSTLFVGSTTYRLEAINLGTQALDMVDLSELVGGTELLQALPVGFRQVKSVSVEKLNITFSEPGFDIKEVLIVCGLQGLDVGFSFPLPLPDPENIFRARLKVSTLVLRKKNSWSFLANIETSLSGLPKQINSFFQKLSGALTISPDKPVILSLKRKIADTTFPLKLGGLRLKLTVKFLNPKLIFRAADKPEITIDVDVSGLDGLNQLLPFKVFTDELKMAVLIKQDQETSLMIRLLTLPIRDKVIPCEELEEGGFKCDFTWLCNPDSYLSFQEPSFSYTKEGFQANIDVKGLDKFCIPVTPSFISAFVKKIPLLGQMFAKNIPLWPPPDIIKWLRRAGINTNNLPSGIARFVNPKFPDRIVTSFKVPNNGPLALSLKVANGESLNIINIASIPRLSGVIFREFTIGTAFGLPYVDTDIEVYFWDLVFLLPLSHLPKNNPLIVNARDMESHIVCTDCFFVILGGIPVPIFAAPFYFRYSSLIDVHAHGTVYHKRPGFNDFGIIASFITGLMKFFTDKDYLLSMKDFGGVNASKEFFVVKLNHERRYTMLQLPKYLGKTQLKLDVPPFDAKMFLIGFMNFFKTLQPKWLLRTVPLRYRLFDASINIGSFNLLSVKFAASSPKELKENKDLWRHVVTENGDDALVIASIYTFLRSLELRLMAENLFKSDLNFTATAGFTDVVKVTFQARALVNLQKMSNPLLIRGACKLRVFRQELLTGEVIISAKEIAVSGELKFNLLGLLKFRGNVAAKFLRTGEFHLSSKIGLELVGVKLPDAYLRIRNSAKFTEVKATASFMGSEIGIQLFRNGLAVKMRAKAITNLDVSINLGEIEVFGVNLGRFQLDAGVRVEIVIALPGKSSLSASFHFLGAKLNIPRLEFDTKDARPDQITGLVLKLVKERAVDLIKELFKLDPAKYFKAIMDGVIKIGKEIVKVAKVLLSKGLKLAGNIANELGKLLNKFANAAKELAKAAKTAKKLLSETAKAARKAAEVGFRVAKATVKIAKKTLQVAGKALGHATEALRDTLRNVGNLKNQVQQAKRLVNAVGKQLANVARRVSKLVKKIAQEIMNGIRNAVGKVIKTVTGWFGKRAIYRRDALLSEKEHYERRKRELEREQSNARTKARSKERELRKLQEQESMRRSVRTRAANELGEAKKKFDEAIEEEIKYTATVEDIRNKGKCLTGENNCHPNATCLRSGADGQSFTCYCRRGWEGNGVICNMPIKQVSIIADSPKAVGEPVDFVVFTLSGTNVEYKFSFKNSYSTSSYQVHTFHTPGVHTIWAHARNPVSNGFDSEQVIVETPVSQLNLTITGDNRACRPVIFIPSAAGTNVSFDVTFGDNSSAVDLTDSVTHYYNQSGTYTVTVTAKNLVSSINSSYSIKIKETPCDKMYCDISRIEKSLHEKVEWPEIASRALALSQSSADVMNDVPEMWKYISTIYPLPLNETNVPYAEDYEYIGRRIYNVNDSKIDLRFVLAGMMGSDIDRHVLTVRQSGESRGCNPVNNVTTKLLNEALLQLSEKNLLDSWNTHLNSDEYCNKFHLKTTRIRGAIDGYILGQMEFNYTWRLSEILYKYYCPSSNNDTPLPVTSKYRYISFVQLFNEQYNQHVGSVSTLDNFKMALRKVANLSFNKKAKPVCLRHFTEYVEMQIRNNSAVSESSCLEWNTCSDCLVFGTKDNCTWCESSSTCQPKSNETSCTSEQLYELLPCPSACRRHLNCSQCIAVDGCGWCRATGTPGGKCLEGDTGGPHTLEYCDQQQWYTERCDSSCDYKNNKKCNNNGNCISGKCICYSGYFGKDCAKEGCVYTTGFHDDLSTVASKFKINLDELAASNNNLKDIKTWLAANSIVTIPTSKDDVRCLNYPKRQLFNSKFPRILRRSKNIANKDNFCGLFGSLSIDNADAKLCKNITNKEGCQDNTKCVWNPIDPCTGMLIEGCAQLSLSTQLLVAENQTIFSPISGNTKIGRTFSEITGWPDSEWEHYTVTVSHFRPLNITSTQAGKKLGLVALSGSPVLPNYITVLVAFKGKEQDPAKFLHPCAPGCYSTSQLADGLCDASCNVSDCNFDQGDCEKTNDRRIQIKLPSNTDSDMFTDRTWNTLYQIQKMTRDEVFIKRGPLSVYALAEAIVSDWLLSPTLSPGLVYNAIKERNILRKLFTSLQSNNEIKEKMVVEMAKKLIEIGTENVSPYGNRLSDVQALDIKVVSQKTKTNLERVLQLLQKIGKLGYVLVNSTRNDNLYFHLEIRQRVPQSLCSPVEYVPIVSQTCDPIRSCSGHGICKVNGSCLCDVDYIGHDCSMSTCLNNCSSHGACIKGECICEQGWSGKDCSAIKFCTKFCLDVWIGDGKCDPNCDIPKCKNDGGDCTNVCACPVSWLGDGSCDLACNTSTCEHDNGDCLQKVENCNAQCKTAMLGDGYCDKECNVESCTFDNGDCKSKTKCDCEEDLQGNGVCNEECNTESCMFDFGDCVAQQIVDTASCPRDCPPSMIGNGFCDLVCNSTSCGFDGGDCTSKVDIESVCNAGCVTSFRGDGQCDSVCNVMSCDFDNNDCPKPLVKMCSPGCEITMVGDRKCQAPCFVQQCSYDATDCECAPGCSNSSIGNGVCESRCLVAGCEYDGEDCACPPNKCPANLIGNGVCNLQCNTRVCDFDGGDCTCAPGCSVTSVGDGWCDRECDTKACKFDGLDCGGCQADSHLNLCDQNAYCHVVNDSLPFLRCMCKPSYYGDGFSCIEQGKCFNTSDTCSAQARCLNVSGTFECHCKDGWKGNGLFCENINECAANLHNCSEQAICADTPGSYVCECKKGWFGDGFNCTDINECVDKVYSHKCCGNEKCINTDGSYGCACKEGWRVTNETEDLRAPSTCVMKVNVSYFVNEKCIDVDECTESLDNCSKVNGIANAECVNNAGGFICTCNKGWEGDGWFCADVDECEFNDTCREQQVCINTLGKFTCSCKKGWVFNDTETERCEDVDECSLQISTCHEFATCINTNGSYDCICRDGFEDEGRVCSQYECSNSSSHFSNNTVFNSGGVSVNVRSDTLCMCVGSYSNAGRICSDADECESENYSCPDFAPVCFNTVGGYECKCDVDGNATCETFNPCQSGNNSCHPNMTCVVSGLEYYCVCPDGYDENPDGDGCVDKNECVNPDVYPCPQDADCVNVPGSYDCRCRKGYLERGGACFEIDECESVLSYGMSGHLQECRAGVCASVRSCLFPQTNESRADNASLVCACNQANTRSLECIYAKTEVIENENSDNVTTLLSLSWQTMFDSTKLNSVAPAILRHNCSLSNATCKNTPGSYECHCNPGFYSNDSGRHCYDEDECLRNDSCDPNASCINTIGSFKCACNKGFSGDGRTNCSDDNECELSAHNCHENASCTNTFGSFDCECKYGYQGNGTFCEDLNECLNNTLNRCHPSAKCFNYIGGYHCHCTIGYIGDGRRCRDVDECANRTQLCGPHASCYNTPGSYKCKCDRGWTGDGQNCTNVNECSLGLHKCVEHSQCQDYAGGYVCECDHGWTRQWFEPYGRCSKCDSSLLCSNHGQCLRDGSCDCLTYYGGQNCSVCKPEVRCSGHGSCDFNGRCYCSPGWTRQPLDCSVCIPEQLCSGHGRCNYDLSTYGNNSCYCSQGRFLHVTYFTNITL